MSEEKIRISVIGTGRMGYYHARLLSRLGYLDSIVDINSLRAKKVGQQFKTPWFTSIESMVEQNSPNGAVIAVPTSQHHIIAEKIIKSIPKLRSLLIEKPLASSVEEAVALKSKLAKTDIKVIVGHIEVFNPVVARMQEIISQGLLGDIRSALFQRRGAVGEARIESIGDVYEDVGVHDFDIVSRILPKGNIQLYSTAVKMNGVDNSSTIVIASEKEEFYATLLMSREYAGKLRTIDIEGTKATLCANMLTQILELRSLEIARGEKDISAIRIPFSSGEQVKVYGEPLLLEIWNFIDCIRDQAVPLVSIDDGINALKLVEASRKSINSKNIVKIMI